MVQRIKDVGICKLSLILISKQCEILCSKTKTIINLINYSIIVGDEYIEDGGIWALALPSLQNVLKR